MTRLEQQQSIDDASKSIPQNKMFATEMFEMTPYYIFDIPNDGFEDGNK